MEIKSIEDIADIVVEVISAFFAKAKKQKIRYIH